MSLEPVTNLSPSYEIIRTPRPEWPRRPSLLLDHGEPANFCPEGLMGGVGRNRASGIWPACRHYFYKHTHTVMNKHACLHHPTVQKTHTQRTRMPHPHSQCNQYSVSQAVWEEYWLLSRKGWSGQLINDPTESLGLRLKRHNNTERAEWAAQQTELSLLIFKAALDKIWYGKKKRCWCFIISYHKAEQRIKFHLHLLRACFVQ